MVTLLFVAVLCFFGVRLVLSLVGKARSTTAAVKAKSHWLWIAVAVIVALAFARSR